MPPIHDDISFVAEFMQETELLDREKHGSDRAIACFSSISPDEGADAPFLHDAGM